MQKKDLKKAVEKAKTKTQKIGRKGGSQVMHAAPTITGVVIGATLGGLTAAALTHRKGTKQLAGKAADKAQHAMKSAGDTLKKANPMKSDSSDGLTRGQKAARTAEKRYGKDFFQTIGAKGGRAAQRRNTAHQLTKAEKSKGGEISSSQQDMSELGRKGGEA